MCGVSHLNLVGHWQKSQCHAPGATPNRAERSRRQPLSSGAGSDELDTSAGEHVSTLKRKRPPHPIGLRIEFSTQLLSVVQFCNTFSQHIRIDSVSAEEFDAALAAASMRCTRAHKITHHDLLAQVHIGLLRTITDSHIATSDVGSGAAAGSSGGGYTGDVCNERTWTECLDQYLSRTHEMKVGAFVGANYYRLSKNERLDLLDILVNDCLDTKVIKGCIDCSLKRCVEIRREMHVAAEKKTDERRAAHLALVKEEEQLLTEIRSQQHRLKILKASSGHGGETSREEGSTDEREERAEGDDDTRVEREGIIRHIVASQKLLKQVRTKMYDPEIRRASQVPFSGALHCALDAAVDEDESSSSSSPSPNEDVVMKPTQGPEETEVEGDTQRGKGGRIMAIDEERDGVFEGKGGQKGDEEEDAERLLGGGLTKGCGQVASNGNVRREVLKGVQGGAVGGKGAEEESASEDAVERSKDVGAEVGAEVLLHTANARDCYKVRKHNAAMAYVPAHGGGGEGWIAAGGGWGQGVEGAGGWAGGEAGGWGQGIRMGGAAEDSMDTDLKLDHVFFILFFLFPTSRAVST